jgi:hypothetical protein
VVKLSRTLCYTQKLKVFFIIPGKNMAEKREKFYFEKNWQEKLSRAIEKAAGEEVRDLVLQGGEGLTQETGTTEKIIWTCGALDLLAENTDEETSREILIGCACRYPLEDLADVKEAYQSSGDIDSAVEMLQEKFQYFLRERLDLEEELITKINSLGWGPAGRREGNTIISTKIPKSGFLVDYFNQTDPEEKRRTYCHCPRVRDGVGLEPALPEVYCYCGAGFYQGIWEEILGEPVRVEVLESVMAGGDVCKIAIHLPVE